LPPMASAVAVVSPPQTALNDLRIKAVAVTAAVVETERLFATMPVATTTPKVLETCSSFHRNVVKLVAYRRGVSMDHIPGLVAANKRCTFEPFRLILPASPAPLPWSARPSTRPG
jgi:hypothetical protein